MSLSEKRWNKIVWVLWVGLVCALPLTSVPLVAKLTRTESVAPGSLIFLLPLVLITVPGILIYKKRLPFQSKPALLFFFFAFMSILLALFRDVPDFKNQAINAAAVEGAVTLGVGLLFFLISLSVPNDGPRIEKTLRILNWVGLVLVAWSIIAVLIKQFVPGLRPLVNEIQSIFSVTRVTRARMTGFASEPSWLAHMLNLVFLPYWLAATFRKTSSHRWKIWKLTFENVLLVGGTIVLVGTFSRGGLAAFMLVIAFLFVIFNIKLIRWLSRKWKGNRRGLWTVIFTLGILLVYLGLLLGGLFVLSKVDPRMEDVFVFSSDSANPLIKYADNLQFGDRVVYWQTGWNIFNDHPLVGVGVGFSGFYFPGYLADAGWGLTETKDLLYRSQGLMNIKNIWSRLLAETGIVGFALFLTMLFVSAATSINMTRSKNPGRQTPGYMGVFMLIALLIEGFSVDSFALPYIWFTLGLTAAAWRWYFPKGIRNGSI